MSAIYRNKLLINQRGGSIQIDNTTEAEKVVLSQRNGGNIKIANAVTSELAPNNKQVNIVNDKFETVGNNSNEFIAGDKVERVGETSYSLKGFIDDSQIDACDTWKTTISPIAENQSRFKIKRGGYGFPNGISVEPAGERADNPVIGSKIHTVENKFNGYSGVPVRHSEADEVTSYVKVPDRGNTKAAEEREVTEDDIEVGAGASGSEAPGVMEFGPTKSAATEGGEWEDDEEAVVDDQILDLQNTLNEIEQNIGNGGDEISFTKRNRIDTVGAVFNDFPSIKIDPKGRSQPVEMVVGKTGAFKNHDYIPLVEEVDNSSNFIGGEETKIVGNKYTLRAGSGGIEMKTTGSHEMGGAVLKASYQKAHITGTQGVHIGSENAVDITSLKSITLRCNRQVYVETALGIKGNIVIGGGSYTEGETYLHHVTAPLEVQQTEDTLLFGQFNTDTARSLVIGEVNFGGTWFPVYALPTKNLIVNYPHSHHFNNLPLRLTENNEDVRKFAQSEDINKNGSVAQSRPQNHERKYAMTADS